MPGAPSTTTTRELMINFSTCACGRCECEDERDVRVWDVRVRDVRVCFCSTYHHVTSFMSMGFFFFLVGLAVSCTASHMIQESRISSSAVTSSFVTRERLTCLTTGTASPRNPVRGRSEPYLPFKYSTYSDTENGSFFSPEDASLASARFASCTACTRQQACAPVCIAKYNWYLW